MNVEKEAGRGRVFGRPGAVVLALDHGFSMGPLPGISNLAKTVEDLGGEDIDGLVIHWGALRNLPVEVARGLKCPIIVHCAGGSLDGSKEKFVSATPRQALEARADMVSFQLNLHSANQIAQVELASRFIRDAVDANLPCLLMIYGGPGCESSVRLGIELGADAVKVDVGTDLAAFRRAAADSPIPLLVAGGDKSENFRGRMSEAMSAGAAGVSVGRNIFQSSDPRGELRNLIELVRASSR